MNTKQKIEVMQAFEDGLTIEQKHKSESDMCWKDGWTKANVSEPIWDWATYNYRVKPTSELDQFRAHLGYIRELVCQACNVGFNPLEGSWADKLFQSNQETSRLLDR